MKLFASIRARLILLVLVVLLPPVLLTLYTVSLNRQMQVDEAKARLLVDARMAKTSLQSDLVALQQATALLDLIPAVHGWQEPECSQALAVLLQNADYVGALTLDTEGMSRCNGLDGNRVPRSYADREYFAKTLHSGLPVVGNPVNGRLTGKPGLPVTLPVKNAQGKTVGMLVTVLDLARFSLKFLRISAQKHPRFPYFSQ